MFLEIRHCSDKVQRATSWSMTKCSEQLTDRQTSSNSTWTWRALSNMLKMDVQYRELWWVSQPVTKWHELDLLTHPCTYKYEYKMMKVHFVDSDKPRNEIPKSRQKFTLHYSFIVCSLRKRSDLCLLQDSCNSINVQLYQVLSAYYELGTDPA